jgi:hypothetical protein
VNLTVRRTLYSETGKSPGRVELNERSQYFGRSADGAVHDPAASMDVRAETKGSPVGIAKDLSVMRIDHISTKGKLHGVWQDLGCGSVFDFKEMNRRLANVCPKLQSREKRT